MRIVLSDRILYCLRAQRPILCRRQSEEWQTKQRTRAPLLVSENVALIPEDYFSPTMLNMRRHAN